jgi:two-component system LytT family sensor kinase
MRSPHVPPHVMLSLLAWAAATLIEATLISAQENVWFVFAFMSSGVKYATLACVAVPIWQVCDRLVRGSFSARQRVLAHIVMGITALAVWQSIYYGFLYLQIGTLRPLNLSRTAGWQAINAVFTYTLLVSVIVAQQTTRRLREQRTRERELALLAQEAEIMALKAQIRPHFLFNVLNSIYALIPAQPMQAQAMVERLADLMRHTLEAAEESLVPLSAELTSVQNYLQIEQIRLGDRLHITFDVNDAPLDALVPPLVFQPLVENAIKHGIAPFGSAGRIEVRAAACSDGVELVVRDSGPGMAAGGEADGRGLRLTTRRLRQFYGDRFLLDLHNLEPTGFESRLKLPIDPIGVS